MTNPDSTAEHIMSAAPYRALAAEGGGEDVLHPEMKCIHGVMLTRDDPCVECQLANLALQTPENEAASWAILQALHDNIPADKRPQSWSDMRRDQELRIRRAAQDAIASLRRSPATERPLRDELMREARDVVEQAMDCIRGETPEDCTEEDARAETLYRLRRLDERFTSHLSPPPEPAQGWKLVPVEPTDAMLEAALDESGQRATAYTAPRESGMPTDSDLSEDEAAWINDECKQAHGHTYQAMLAASPQPSAPVCPRCNGTRSDPEAFGHNPSERSACLACCSPVAPTQPALDEVLVEQLARALEGVVRVADRSTVEFDAAHDALAAYTARASSLQKEPHA